MGEVLKKFSRYFLLDHIAQGGMAEIYRARQASMDGAGRLLVIKRIQAGYGSNREFVSMFRSEIEVTMKFNHPNIVQLYDTGEENNQPYIAMELVDGKNVRQLINRFNEVKQPFPVELAAYIAEQAASGLNYAHSFKDKITGEALDVVHRDISPQNILVSYEGGVKVIDFGIAKATTNLENTRAGVIKGKPSYLAPEQISGDKLDGRCDIFALGAVLWEMLTGRKLFAGENDLAVLKLIESSQTYVKKPSTVNSKVPPALDEIVMKALTKNPNDRYATAGKMQLDLHKFLNSAFPDFNPSELPEYLKKLFQDEIVEDRKRLQKLIEKADQMLSIQFNHETPSSSGITTVKPSKREDTTTVVEQRAIGLNAKDREIQIEIEPSKATIRPEQKPATKSAPYKASAPRQRPPVTSPRKKIFVGIAATVALALFGPSVGIKIPIVSDLVSGLTDGDEARLYLEGNYKDVSVTVNGQVVANSIPIPVKGLPVGAPFTLIVTGPQGAFQQEMTLKKGEKKRLQITLSPDRSIAAVPSSKNTVGSKTVMLRLNLVPGGGQPQVSVNGHAIDIGNPVIQVPLDETLELNVERNGFRPLHREFVLEASRLAGLKEWPMDVQLEPVKFGFLTIQTTPSADAEIMIDGRPWVKKTPLENEKLPVGTYQIKLTNEVLGMEKKVTVSVQEGKVMQLNERLQIKN